MRIGNAMTTVRTAVLTVALLLTSLGRALAGTPVVIPPGDLQMALDRFASLFGVQLIYRSDDIKGVVSRGASGELSAGEALQRLLAGTQLEAKSDGDAAFVVFPRNPPSALDNTSDATYHVLVTGVSRHLAEENSTGTRSNLSPLALPQSISTLDGEELQRQGTTTLAEAVSRVAGVANPGTSGSLNIRGFSAGVLRNGILDPSQDVSAFTTPTIAIERIEVLKGPEAVIAGQAAGYGGVVNIITKKAQTRSHREIAAYIDDSGRRELGADVAGRLTDDGRLFGRLILSRMEESRDRLGLDGGRRAYVAPALGYANPRSGTEMALAFERNEQSNRNWWQAYYDEATQSLGDRLRPVRLGDNRKVVSDGIEETWSFTGSQKLSEHWRLGLRLLRISTELDFPGARVGLVPPGSYPRVVGIDFIASTRDEKSARRLDLRGTVDTGPVTHTLLLAHDTDTRELKRMSALVQASFDATTGLETSLARSTPWTVEQQGSPRETGVLVMDHAVWGPWVGMLGLRRVGYRPNDALTPDGEPFRTTLPSLGVAYRLNPGYSIYVSRSRAATPVMGAIDYSTGREVEPNRAVQNEFGFKASHPDGDLALSGALFQIDETSRAIADPRNLGYALSVSGVTSRGLDVEVSGTLQSRWDIRLAYAFLDIAQLAGDNQIQYAKHQYSLGLTYRLAGEATGWSIGGRLIGRSSAPSGEQAISGGQIVSPSSIRCDVSAVYAAKHWSLAVGVKNLADRMNYTLHSGIAGSGFLEQARQGYLSLNYLY